MNIVIPNNSTYTVDSMAVKSFYTIHLDPNMHFGMEASSMLCLSK